MRASIIITTYNRPLYLKRAIQSVLKQNTSYSYEVIVIDDNGLGSLTQQETQKLVKALDHNIVYYPLEQNSGACVARNKGVEIAKGEFIFFLDDDDEFLPNKVETQVSVLQKKQELDGCLAGFKRIDEKNNTEIVSEANFPVVGSFTNFAIKGNCFTPMLCIRKEAIQKIGGFDVISRFQDRFLMLKALCNGLVFESLNEQLHIMYEHAGLRITEAGINKSLQALDTIKNYITKTPIEWSDNDWKLFCIKDDRMRGMIHYNSNNYFIRLKGFKFFLQALIKSKSKNDFTMMIKTLLKLK